MAVAEIAEAPPTAEVEADAVWAVPDPASRPALSAADVLAVIPAAT
jgi:hypothetical protein